MNRSSRPGAGGEERLPEVLWEDGERRFCRIWRRGADGARHACIAVVPAAEHPTAAGIGRLAHEYALREHLDGEWALRPLELVRERGRTVLVLEYHDGVPLERLIAPRLETGRFLRLAVALGDSLARLHERGLVHRDVKPANVLVDAGCDRVRLTGFGVASRLPREHQAPEPPELIAGTLAYMAPEQTGRMNRSVDSRSDLYSLGVTLYQALTGSLPFTASDPMEWVHCHIARKPAPPETRAGDVPPQLSAILLKLLAKTPEERYQTAAGVARDFRRCLADWESRRAVGEFPPGELDTPDRLLIPERLYGREDETRALLAAFEHAAAGGAPRLVVVRGPAGIGKSSVVSELHRVLAPSRGLFASGKFDQLKRSVPRATLAQAFGGLIRHLLSRPEAELSRWRDDLRRALDPGGALVVELVPELKLVIGEQPAVPDLPPADAKARFQVALRRLVGVFAGPEHPLVLFLDDLQWLDAGTLDLLQDLLAQPDLRHLLLVGAYRDDEVDAAHPLARRLAAIRGSGADVQEITLAPLTHEDLARLVADALRCGPGRAAPLARVLLEKTGGNPFFAKQLVHALAEEGVIAFDPGTATWLWDPVHVQAGGHTEQVVDLVAAKLARLPPATLNALRELACLGSTADASTLAIVQETPEEDVHAGLWEALAAGLVVRSEHSYRFVHDRVQEAAYSLIPEDRRAQAHLRIGRLLKGRVRGDEAGDAIFDAVDQLNRGTALITSRDEREELAALNLAAGKRARAAAAYASAHDYLLAGAALVGEDCWERRHGLVWELELHRAECEFLTGQAGSAEERLVALSPRAADAVERAAAACLLADVYVALQRLDRSVAVCLECLRHAGLHLPVQPTAAQTRAAYDHVWSKLGERPVDELAELPLMTDPASCATLDVLAKIARCALTQMDIDLLSVILCAAVELSLEGGNCDSSCYAYEYFGVVAAWRFGDFEAGFRFGLLGHELVERKGLRRFEALVRLTLANRVMPWARHVASCRELVRSAFDLADRSGDRISAVSSRCVLVSNLLMAGEPLAVVEAEAEAGLAFCRRAGFRDFVDAADTQAALVRNLRGRTRRFGSLDDDRFDELRLQDRFASEPHALVFECWYWIRRLQARFLAGDYPDALDSALRARALLHSSPALLEAAEYELYGALAHAAACDAASAGERRQHLEAVASHGRRLDLWARHCPDNFGDRAALVAAELARLEGRDPDAMRLYEEAIRSARENGFVHIEALAAELAARFYAGRGFDRLARASLRDARHAYLQWGADGKVRQLEELYPYLGDEDPRPDPARTIQTPAEQLDLGVVLRVLEAVSGETDPERLIATVMRLGLEHAGAGRGLLILPRGDELRVEAGAEVSGDGVRVALRRSAATAGELPESVLHYVLRTGETVLLHDASAENPFSGDEYLRRRRARSVLCMPLLKQTRLVGLIYLENDLASGVFTPARMAVLKLLASEAAISLESARLYRDVREREARVRRLVDSNIIGIVIWHADGRILDTNDAFLRIVGYDRAELVSGRVTWPELTPPEWHDRDAPALAELEEAGAVQAHEQEYLRKDGTRVPVLTAGAVFDGAPDEGVAFVLDLTELKRAEQARRESEHEWRRIVDTIPGLVCLLTAAGGVEVVNRQLLEYFGQTLEELRQWGTDGTVHPDDMPHVAEVFTRSIASGSPYVILQRFRRWDGVYRWFENSGHPLRDADGRIVRWCVLLTDIDERKRAEDALRESERESRLIVESIPGLIAVFTPGGECEFVNRQGLEYFGSAFEDLQRWGTGGQTHPEDLPRAVELFTRSVVSGDPFEMEVRARRADGVYRWIQSRGHPLRDSNGSIVRWYNLMVDIDERKRAEEALAASERNLKLTVDTIPALAWSTGPGGAADFFNQHYLDFVGLSTEQASGWGWTSTIHPEDIGGLAGTWQRILASGAPGEAEARMRRHDGEYRWFLFRASPLRDESGSIVRWYGVNTDIEDRKRAEAELRRAYDSFIDAQRLSHTGNFTADVVADEHTWSEELRRIFEFDPAMKVTVQAVRDRIHPEDLPTFDAAFARALGGTDFDLVFRIVTPTGTVKHVRSLAHLVERIAGRPLFIGAMQDVTETVLAEEALNRARSELAHVARVSTLGALTASIAHEVAQPLSGIITNASTCLRMLDADPPNLDGARETTRRTIRDGHRASDVITRLRALFGRKEFTQESVDLNEAAREVLALSLRDLQSSHVVVQQELAEDLPSVTGDRVQLQQVILNLLRNASDAMAGVGDRPRHLLIRTGREDGDRVRVTVRDAGAGIDPGSADRLFDAFYTTKSSGMGIGLSVSRSIIERHGGRLWYEPNDGPGATFAFSIPCRAGSRRGAA
jgi:PAS domain S-box-containing protein